MFYRYFAMFLLCLAIQSVQAQGVWSLSETKVEVVKDLSNPPAQWIAGSSSVAAEKRWTSYDGAEHYVILASFSWKGIPQVISEGQEYQTSVLLDQQANNTGFPSGMKIYSAVEGGVEADGPEAGTPWRHSSYRREVSGKLRAPLSPGPRMYIRVRCCVAGDIYHVRYCYTLQGGQKPTPQPPSGDRLGSVWTVVENGVWQGTWTRRPGTQIFDAVWRHPQGGKVSDILEVESIQGDRVVLYRRGNKGRYYGKLSANGRSAQGTMSWNDGGSSWRATW